MIECSAHTRRTFYGKCNTLANESDAQRIVRANPRSPNRLLDFPLWALAVLREPFPPPHLLTTAPLTNCVSTPANTLSSSANTLSAQTNTLATLRNTLFPAANTLHAPSEHAFHHGEHGFHASEQGFPSSEHTFFPREHTFSPR